MVVFFKEHFYLFCLFSLKRKHSEIGQKNLLGLESEMHSVLTGACEVI